MFHVAQVHNIYQQQTTLHQNNLARKEVPVKMAVIFGLAFPLLYHHIKRQSVLHAGSLPCCHLKTESQNRC